MSVAAGTQTTRTKKIKMLRGGRNHLPTLGIPPSMCTYSSIPRWRFRRDSVKIVSTRPATPFEARHGQSARSLRFARKLNRKIGVRPLLLDAQCVFYEAGD